jgi:hypothetical protein
MIDFFFLCVNICQVIFRQRQQIYLCICEWTFLFYVWFYFLCVNSHLSWASANLCRCICVCARVYTCMYMHIRILHVCARAPYPHAPHMTCMYPPPPHMTACTISPRGGVRCVGPILRERDLNWTIRLVHSLGILREREPNRGSGARTWVHSWGLVHSWGKPQEWN